MCVGGRAECGPGSRGLRVGSVVVGSGIQVVCPCMMDQGHTHMPHPVQSRSQPSIAASGQIQPNFLQGEPRLKL